MTVFVHENTQNGDLRLRYGLCPFTDVCSIFSSYHVGIKVTVVS